MSKGPDAFRTISEVAEELDLPQHVLRFWETRFSQIKPLKRGGGRRYYRPDDIDLLRGIRLFLYGEGYTIKGVQRILKEQGSRYVISAGRGEHAGGPASPRPPKHRSVEAESVHEAESGDAVPELELTEPTAVQVGARNQTTAQPLLDGGDVAKLKATLSELHECKRLLDEVR